MNQTEHKLGDCSLYQTTSDTNGNPRYVVSWTAFPANSYLEAINLARDLGFKRYRGKDFGGGLVVTTYNIPYLIKTYNALVETRKSTEDCYVTLAKSLIGKE